MSIPWSLSSQSDMLRKMSALCYLFARNIQDLMIKEGVAPPPIGEKRYIGMNLSENVFLGLVDADWGGTPIEAWSPKSAINICNSSISTICATKNQSQFCDSSLWNAMVNPLKWNSLKVFLKQICYQIE